MPNDDLLWLADFEFARIDRRGYALEDWAEIQPESAVESLSRAITDEYRVRKALPRDHPQYVSPLKWLKPVCYNAILTCLHYELFEALAARNEKHRRLRSGPLTDRSIFMTGLVGIFAHDVPKILPENKYSSCLTTVEQRNRMAREMLWAYTHYIAPSELLEFNRKSACRRSEAEQSRKAVVPTIGDFVIVRHLAAQIAVGKQISSVTEYLHELLPPLILKGAIYQLNMRQQIRRDRLSIVEPYVLSRDWDAD